MTRSKNRILCAVGLSAFVAACSAGAPEPVEIAFNEEACHQCRMAISQQEFAAEIVTATGAVHYFDDIGCMGRWMADHHPPESSGLFVTDYDTRGWLDAQTAHYVRSDRLPTPMKHGLAAFETRSRADAAAKKLEGEVLNWMQILEGGT